MHNKLEVIKLNGTDTESMNAFVNAVRADGFITFVGKFKEQLPDFFKKCFITTDDGQKDLSIAYKTLPLEEVENLFDAVYTQRKEQLAFIFKERKVVFNDLDTFDQIKYDLMFQYGDKLGGWLGVAGMEPETIFKTYEIFTQLQKKQSDAWAKAIANQPKENKNKR